MPEPKSKTNKVTESMCQKIKLYFYVLARNIWKLKFKNKAIYNRTNNITYLSETF